MKLRWLSLDKEQSEFNLLFNARCFLFACLVLTFVIASPESVGQLTRVANTTLRFP
jgi:hypothetical protein